MSKDMKEALGSARKADVTHVRGGIKRYIARACEYGSDKYERANFLRDPAGDGLGASFERLRAYLRAAISHLDATLDAMELHQAGDPRLLDAVGMRRAAYAEDTDAKPGCKVGASHLPHLAHGAASLMMAIEQATTFGLLPHDPGTPWRGDRTVLDALAHTDDALDEIAARTRAEQYAEDLAGIPCQIDASCRAGCDSDGVPRRIE